ncbi:hypothetical protein BD414DRAFT_421962 [Trametes punicea]|nr:hypothetical protein BD414DRAFT_421962 [Trametes punicea]
MSSHQYVPPANQNEGDKSPSLIQHPDYYFEDGNLVILVENTLFRLFRSTFTRHSVVFRDLFSLPTGQDGMDVEGHNDDNPLHFSGISATDFERLLWVLYPSNYGFYRATSVDEWRSILSLATLWEFTDVRALAIRSLQVLNMSPVERIVLAQEFDIDGRWTLSAYIALCERPEPLSLAEASQLGLDISIRIAQLREQLRARGHKSSNMGGYHSLTHSAALRHGTAPPRTAGSSRPQRPAERLQWDVAKSFLVQGEIPPPARGPFRKTGVKASPTSIPGTGRLVAQAFGIDIGQ